MVEQTRRLLVAIACIGLLLPCCRQPVQGEPSSGTEHVEAADVEPGADKRPVAASKPMNATRATTLHWLIPPIDCVASARGGLVCWNEDIVVIDNQALPKPPGDVVIASRRSCNDGFRSGCRAAADGNILMFHTADTLTAIGVAGDTLWSTEAKEVMGGALTDKFVVIVSSEDGSSPKANIRLDVFDRNDGQSVASHLFEGLLQAPLDLRVNETLTIVSHGLGTISCLETETGRVLWVNEDLKGPGRADVIALSSVSATLQTGGDIRTLDLADGQEITSFDLHGAGRRRPANANGNVLYAPVWNEEKGGVRGAAASLQAIDAVTGDVMWSRSPQATPHYLMPQPAFGDSSVYACLGDGTLRAFDQGKGQELWHWGMGVCTTIGVMFAEGGEPVVLVPTPDGKIWAIAPSEEPTPLQQVTIKLTVGGLSAPVDAMVGDQRVTVPEAGTVEVELETRGYVMVAVQGREPTWVFVDHSGTYDVDVPAAQ